MSTYIFVIIASITIGIAIADNKRRVKIIGLGRKPLNNRRVYCIFFALIIILIIGLRSPTVGPDTYGYYMSYQLDSVTIQSFLVNYSAYLRAGISNFFSDKNTVLFHLIFSIFNHIGLSFNACLVVLATAYVAPIFYFILRDSENVWKSCYWFLVFSFSIALSGVRITLSIGLTTISYICIIKRKRVLSVLFFILAVMIHLSAVIFFVAFFLTKIKIEKRSVYYLIPAFIVAPLFGRIISPAVLRLTYYRDSIVLSWNLSVYLFFSITTILLIWFSENRNTEFLKMMIMGTFVCGLINYGAFGNMHRYFTQYMCVCLPGLLKNYNKSTKTIVELLYFFVGIYIFFRTFSIGNRLVPYKFFWQ